MNVAILRSTDKAIVFNNSLCTSYDTYFPVFCAIHFAIRESSSPRSNNSCVKFESVSPPSPHKGNPCRAKNGRFERILCEEMCEFEHDSKSLELPPPLHTLSWYAIFQARSRSAIICIQVVNYGISLSSLFFSSTPSPHTHTCMHSHRQMTTLMSEEHVQLETLHRSNGRGSLS